MTQGRWSSFQSKGSGSQYVDKADWADRGIEFLILKVDERGATTGKDGRSYGASWELDVLAVGEQDKMILSFSQGSDSRDEALEAARDGLASGLTSIGPIIINKVRTKSGRPFYRLDEPEGVTDADVAEAPARLANQDDDELPF